MISGTRLLGASISKSQFIWEDSVSFSYSTRAEYKTLCFQLRRHHWWSSRWRLGRQDPFLGPLQQRHESTKLQRRSKLRMFGWWHSKLSSDISFCLQVWPEPMLSLDLRLHQLCNWSRYHIKKTQGFSYVAEDLLWFYLAKIVYVFIALLFVFK